MNRLMTALTAFALVIASAAAETKTQVLTAEAAHAFDQGFLRDGEEIVIDNGDASARQAGAVWNLRLNQLEPLPFKVRTEAKCEKGPGGGRTREFSLYVDLTYTDGSRLYGQISPFAPDPAKGWRKGCVTVIPEKPVRTASIYCLYRNLPGRVRFRAPQVTLNDCADLSFFDSIPVSLSQLPASEPGFLLRDVRNDDDYFERITTGELKDVKLDVTETAINGGKSFRVKVNELSGKDRAVTLVYVVPLPEGEIVFEQDPRTSIPLPANSAQRSDASGIGCGAGGLNRWPFGAVSVAGKGIALGIDTARPAFFRTAVHPRSRLLFIAFDLGFAPEKRTAEFGFYKFDFTGNFRDALTAYAKIEKDAFKTRVPEHGIWMPFASIKNVEGWEDFGFKFKEGDSETSWDDAHNIFTFRYTEPTTWWVSLDKAHGTNALTMAELIKKCENLAAKGNAKALAWKNAVILDEEGGRVGKLTDKPWCRGGLWILSPLPGIEGMCDYRAKNSESDYAKFYAKPMPQGLDGEYIDSAECYLTPTLDYNRAVFSASETPLVFSNDDSLRPAIFKGLSIYEYVRLTARRVWPKGRFMMANGVPGRWPWYPAYVDVGGTETKWIDNDGNWKPESHSSLIYKRAMSMGKPYCYLQNVNFEKFKYEDMENFMRHCVAYGFFPGCFSHNASEAHYFKRPEIYNRDRPLFKKYVPLCKMLSEAGWRANNTLVKTDDARVFAEQFGDRYVTVFNSAKETLRVSLKSIGPMANAAKVREFVNGGEVIFNGGTAEAVLKSDAVLVLDFKAE